MAALSQLDDPADSRAVALTDWDGDGDLDVWITNRTEPRIRLWRNPAGDSTHFVALQLVGTQCNRDGIGTRVELRSDPAVADEPSQVRFVRAGDGYLSQSSKWLHFGRGDLSGPVQLTLHWPDGTQERIAGLAGDRAYRIVQGTGRAEPVTTVRPPRKWPSRPAPATAPPPLTRIVAHGHLPLPELPAVQHDGADVDLGIGGGQATLLVLWASWCQPCLRELEQLSEQRDALAKAGIQLWVGNVEDLDQPLEDRRAATDLRLKQAGWHLPGGVLSRDAVQRLNLAQRAVLGRQATLAVPSSFLLDRQHRLTAIYIGPVDPRQPTRDLALVDDSDPINYRNRAVPFPGRWYINAAPIDLLAIPNSLLEAGDPQPAFAYLQRHIGTPQRPAATVDDQWFALFHDAVVNSYRDVGVALAGHQQFAQAAAALSTALEVAPDQWDTLAALASLHGQRGEPREALAVYERMLQLRPQEMSVANNIAWMLATCPDDSVRDPVRALQLAKTVCRATGNRIPTALDTLAAAHAAVGEFDQAQQAAAQALRLPGQTPAARHRLQQRLETYQRGEAYRDPIPVQPSTP